MQAYLDGEKRSAVDVTIDRIIEYMRENRLADGDKLPNERDLCALLGVGRSTLREALQRLSARNVLEVRRGVGVFVSYKHGVAEDPLGITLIHDQKKLVRDLLEFRIMIEPRAAALAAQNATNEDIAELEYLCAAVDRLIMSGKPHLEKDKDFHTCIARCSGNLIMPKLLPIIHSSIGVFIEKTGGLLREETMRTHRAVLNAIRAHDSNAAFDAMYLHLIYNRDQLTSDPILRGGVYRDL